MGRRPPSGRSLLPLAALMTIGLLAGSPGCDDPGGAGTVKMPPPQPKAAPVKAPAQKGVPAPRSPRDR